MEQVSAGKVEKLAILFEKHHVRLYNFFLRLTGRRNISEDLVQEVFIRILK
jgi:RNA polymerase sigma-70 factor (ECF subfamily)